jgi:long-subunit acyl-CoA synthetase (AMP-forming)
MLYTSGTTGRPKGVRRRTRIHRRPRRAAASSTILTADDSILSYLPMAWVGDHLFSMAQWMVAGFTINCPESATPVMTDLREVGPTYYFAPPRVFENLLTQVMIRMEDASASQALDLPPLHGRSRASAAPSSSPARTCRSASASTTRSATRSSTRRCATCSA